MSVACEAAPQGLREGLQAEPVALSQVQAGLEHSPLCMAAFVVPAVGSRVNTEAAVAPPPRTQTGAWGALLPGALF